MLSSTTLRQGLMREPVSSVSIQQVPTSAKSQDLPRTTVLTIHQALSVLFTEHTEVVRIVTSRAICPEKSTAEHSLPARVGNTQFLQYSALGFANILNWEMTHETATTETTRSPTVCKTQEYSTVCVRSRH